MLSSVLEFDHDSSVSAPVGLVVQVFRTWDGMPFKARVQGWGELPLFMIATLQMPPMRVARSWVRGLEERA